MRKMKLIALLLACVCCFTACACNKEDVKLATKKQAARYVEENCAEAKYIEKETGDYAVKYYFEDEEYGFVYYYESYASEVGMDGSVFGYSESSYCNYSEAYYEYINGQIGDYVEDLGEKYGFDLSWKDNVVYVDSKYLLVYSDGSAEDEEHFSEEVYNLLAPIDTRKFFETISFYDMKENFKGEYRFSKQKYADKEECMTEDMMSDAARICGGEVEFLYKESMPVKDVPGIENKKVVYTYYGLQEGEDATLYYFDFEGNTYFISDILIGDYAQMYCSYETSE